MAIDSHHPLYDDRIDDWRQLEDTHRGERRVKQKGQVYLPVTSGMIQDGIENSNQKGYRSYVAYRTRARVPGLVKSAVETCIGVMHNKPPVIELPAAMEPLRLRATMRNESLEMLLRRINQEQLKKGRLGLLAEVRAGVGQPLPMIALYVAEDVINWDATSQNTATEEDRLRLVVLDETGLERGADFTWTTVERFRYLILGDVSIVETEDPNVVLTYKAGLFKKKEPPTFSEEDFKAPSIAGKELDQIPFVFINTKDIVPAPDDPPLLDLSNLVLTIYRGEADYRQALFMQGQDTLVVLGGDADVEYRTGAGAAITPPVGGDAKYIGVDSAGLPEMRSALENDLAEARQKSGQLVDETSREKESGEALRVRVAGKTASLNQIAIAGAFGLQELLRIIARWMGLNPEQVIVTPNLDFVDDDMTGEELVKIMEAKNLGAPISLQSIHGTMQRRGMTEETWDDELKLIEEEKALEIRPEPTTNPDGPSDNPRGSTEE